MQNSSSVARIRGGRSFQHPMDIVLGNRFAAQGDLGVKALRRQEAARHVDDNAADLDARHALGRINCEARRMFRPLKIDDGAALDSVRTLMADPKNLAAMGAAAQRAGRFHRRQSRDQTNDLRGAGVENRQNRALALRNLPHARRRRPEAHGCAPFFGAWASAHAAAEFLRQPHEHAARRAKIERENVSIENAGLALEAHQGSNCGLRVGLRKLDLDSGFQLEVPAALADQNPGLDARLQFVHRVEQCREFANAAIRAFANDEWQVTITAVAHVVDWRAVGGNGAHLPVLLPYAVRRAFDDVDDDLVRVEFPDARLLDEGIGFKSRASRGHVEKRQRVFGADAGDRQNAQFVRMRRAGHRDNFDAEAERARGDVANAAVTRDELVELSATHRAQTRRDE